VAGHQSGDRFKFFPGTLEQKIRPPPDEALARDERIYGLLSGQLLEQTGKTLVTGGDALNDEQVLVCKGIHSSNSPGVEILAGLRA
jgi:hypothetical protein